MNIRMQRQTTGMPHPLKTYNAHNKSHDPEWAKNASRRATPSLSTVHNYVSVFTINKPDPTPCTVIYSLGVVAIWRRMVVDILRRYHWLQRFDPTVWCRWILRRKCRRIIKRSIHSLSNLYRFNVVSSTRTSTTIGYVSNGLWHSLISMFLGMSHQERARHVVFWRNCGAEWTVYFDRTVWYVQPTFGCSVCGVLLRQDQWHPRPRTADIMPPFIFQMSQC